ncbi:(2Fe-2S) ferredoxin domain-containing protein [Patescibacteria group bacterium]|nr:MAG: (2Fe-2S) ferredoxin domain-containing protein [Patescibacteria group bacterium]
MRPAELSFPRLVLVCGNIREDGTESCGAKGGAELHRALKEAVRVVHPEIRVSKSGCLGNCTSGPSVTIMPDGVWLGDVTVNDVPKIVNYLGGHLAALDVPEDKQCCGGGCCKMP